MEFIEISAKTVDEAITKACISLETSSDNLEIQVVTEGSSGFLGFGSKPAVIRVKRKTPEASFESILNEEEKPAPKKRRRNQRRLSTLKRIRILLSERQDLRKKKISEKKEQNVRKDRRREMQRSRFPGREKL